MSTASATIFVFRVNMELALGQATNREWNAENLIIPEISSTMVPSKGSKRTSKFSEIFSGTFPVPLIGFLTQILRNCNWMASTQIVQHDLGRL